MDKERLKQFDVS